MPVATADGDYLPYFEQKPPTKSTVQPQSVESLQLAAQTYPWLYMTSTLEVAFKAAESAAHVGEAYS